MLWLQLVGTCGLHLLYCPLFVVLSRLSPFRPYFNLFVCAGVLRAGLIRGLADALAVRVDCSGSGTGYGVTHVASLLIITHVLLPVFVLTASGLRVSTVL